MSGSASLVLEIVEDSDASAPQAWFQLDADGRLVRVTTASAVPPPDAPAGWVPDAIGPPRDGFARVREHVRLLDNATGRRRFTTFDREIGHLDPPSGVGFAHEAVRGLTPLGFPHDAVRDGAKVGFGHEAAGDEVKLGTDGTHADATFVGFGHDGPRGGAEPVGLRMPELNLDISRIGRG